MPAIVVLSTVICPATPTPEPQATKLERIALTEVPSARLARAAQAAQEEVLPTSHKFEGMPSSSRRMLLVGTLFTVSFSTAALTAAMLTVLRSNFSRVTLVVPCRVLVDVLTLVDVMVAGLKAMLLLLPAFTLVLVPDMVVTVTEPSY